MLPNINESDSKSDHLKLQLHKVPTQPRNSTSLIRARSVIFTSRPFPQRVVDDGTEAAVDHFRASLKASETMTRRESGRVDWSPGRQLPNLTLGRQSVQQQMSPSPYKATVMTTFPSVEDQPLGRKYISDMKTVRRLPLPADTDFEPIVRPRKDEGRRGSLLTNKIDEEMQKDKHAILNLLPLERISKTMNDKPTLVLTEGTQLFWSIQSTSGSRPEAREGASFAWLNRRLYMFGGVSMTKRNEVRALNPDNWTWSMVNAQYIPKGRVGHSMVACHNMLVVYGGWSHYSQRLHMRRCYKKVFVLHMDNDDVKWQRYRGTGNVPKARRYHAACSLGTTMFVYGGITCIIKSWGVCALWKWRTSSGRR